MLSREERIFSELLLARGLVAREFIEGFAKSRNSGSTSLAGFLVEQGGLPRAQADETLEEAQTIDQALAPHLEGGATIGEFRLLRELGRGGMGIVYEAEQESLGRRVALKVLPAGAALDERLAIRFLREARAAARLRHPGIVPVYGAGRAEGVLYFAMELVEGRSLAEVIADGPMPPMQAARVAAEIARALDHAHGEGLVHRDVKPENILLDADGRARLTDFGLVYESVASSFTLERHVLGTPAFMAPEQALGEGVDRRTDVYALGAVLHTLLSGKLPFGGDLPSAVLARVLSSAPPALLSIRPELPRSLVAICEKAMARNPEDRYVTAAELAEDLAAFERGETPPRVVPKARALTLGWRMAAVGVVIIAVGATLAAISIREHHAGTIPAPPRSDPAFQLVNETAGEKSLPSLSPDGTRLAYTQRSPDYNEVYVEDLATREVVRVAQGASGISFSPDGRSVAYRRNEALDILSLRDNSVRHFEGILLGANGVLTWSPDGREVFGAGNATLTADFDGGIRALDVASGRLRVVRHINAGHPAFSPHGSRIAFVSNVGGPTNIWTMSADGTDAIRITNDPAPDWSPFWSSDARRLYFGSERSGTPQLWSVNVDEASGRPTGPPEPALPVAFPGLFSAALSADGSKMALVTDNAPRRLFRISFDPVRGAFTSPPEVFGLPRGAADSPQPSPDGTLVLYTAHSPDGDLAVTPGNGSDPTRLLTSDEFQDGAPRWSPDGKRIAFQSDRSGTMEIWTISPDGSGLRRITKTTSGSAGFPVWSPDGARIAYTVEGVGAFVIAASGEGSPERLAAGDLGAPFTPWAWSRDGDVLAGTAGGIVLYSIRDRSVKRITAFGEKPVWLGDGHRLLFASQRSVYMVAADGSAAQRIFSADPCELEPSIGVSSDGRSVFVSLSASPEQVWIANLPR